MSPPRTLLCFARGRPGAWQALCADFDLAVEGASFPELRSAIADYVEAASQEAEPDRSRRAPLLVTLGWQEANDAETFTLAA